MSRIENGRLGYEKSKGTHQKLKQERIDKYYLNPKRCKYCNAVIEYGATKVFCNSKCFGNSYQIKRQKITIERYEKNPKICKICDKSIPYDKRYNSCCSRECSNSSLRSKFKITTDEKMKNGTCNTPGTIKNWIIAENGKKCVICGLTEWMGKEIPLVLDHIDGNSYNNRIENLRLVCGNCDMQLPTYKGRNRGKGRYERLKYNKEIYDIIKTNLGR